MHLNQYGLRDGGPWAKAGITLPGFDRGAVACATKAEPSWVHFGAGNIFRAFPAAVQQGLLNRGVEQKGVIVAEGYDYEIIDKLFLPYDCLSLLVTLKADGSIEKEVIASVTEALRADSGNAADFARLREIFRAPSLQMVSFTITEKGYSLAGAGGGLLPDVADDFESGPAKPGSYMGKVAALCYERYQNGRLPVALVSMDNCSHNGDKLYDAISAFARAWAKNGLAEDGFLSYIEDPAMVSFPWSMIDKITPRPDSGVEKMLAACGFEYTHTLVTAKNTFAAPFVNAEETQYLVIEDRFPNGRPKLEAGGVIFTRRETVDKVEKMKVCTCLNPLHTALAVFGCLLGYQKISDEMKDGDLVRLIEGIGYTEGLPVVVDPDILDPKAFLDNVLQIRLPNPFMPDTPQRIATDTSQKLSIRFGETIKAYLKSPGLSVEDLKLIPLVLAAWCRYLLGVDDEGNTFQLSPDPMIDTLKQQLSVLTLGNVAGYREALSPILSNEKIFGVNLYEAGLGRRVEALFAAMAAEPGAVRATLKQELG